MTHKLLPPSKAVTYTRPKYIKSYHSQILSVRLFAFCNDEKQTTIKYMNKITSILSPTKY